IADVAPAIASSGSRNGLPLGCPSSMSRTGDVAETFNPNVIVSPSLWMPRRLLIFVGRMILEAWMPMFGVGMTVLKSMLPWIANVLMSSPLTKSALHHSPVASVYELLDGEQPCGE